MVTYQEADCDVSARKVVLTQQQVQALRPGDHCNDETSCAGLVLGNLTMGPATAVIAGTIVVVGNTVFWMEKQGRCLLAE